MVLWLWILACGSPEAVDETPDGPPHHARQAVGIEAQAGEKHPPIPANDPMWKNVNPDFKPVPMAYGEERWDDVSMRVMGHLAQATRDLARLDWQAGNQSEAIAHYRDLSTRLGALKLDEPGTSRTVRTLHVKAANHHAAVLSKQAGLEVNAPQHLGPNSKMRWEKARGDTPQSSGNRPWAGLQIDGFKDFRDRHALRLRMIEYWLDGVDPTAFSDPWGYWRPSVADAVADGKPVAYAKTLTAEDIGRLPTGDSYLDTAGGAGPMSIGTLAVLGLDDPTHRKRLHSWAERLSGLVGADPDGFVQAIENYQSELEAHEHGSRFYNIKQLINAGTRHLARAGHYTQALAVFRLHRPLHAQDWLCPNREGIQLGIEGRLLALSGDTAKARTRLLAAQSESIQWLERISQAKRSPTHRPKGPNPGNKHLRKP